MDVTLGEVQNNIGEIELGDVVWLEITNCYYIVMKDCETKFYYLKAFNGDAAAEQTGEHTTLESLRMRLVFARGSKLIHYPAKEYRLELVKK